jgi:enediyne biosynthesis protein E4
MVKYFYKEGEFSPSLFYFYRMIKLLPIFHPIMSLSFKRISLFFFLIIGFTQCKQSGKPIFKSLNSKDTGIDFINQLTYSDSLTVLEFEYMFNGAGVALADINNDGLLDIFFAGNMVSSRLYLNKGNLHFEDITKKAGVNTDGWCYGVSVVDINQDGFQDFYVCKAGSRKTQPKDMKNLFYINNGNGTFSEKAAEMNLADDGYDIQTAFLDYDKDGDLDMYLLKNAFVNYNRNNARPKQTEGQAPSTGKLFRNDGIENGSLHFTDVSFQAGIRIEGFGLGIAVNDLNNDNYPDIYISNDFLTNDLIYINNQDGTFSNQAGKYLKHQTYNGMGNDVADINNDGLPEVMVVDMLPPDNKRWKLTMMGNTFDEFYQKVGIGYEPQYVRNTLQLNNGLDKNGNPSFSEIGQQLGINATEWSWAPLFADYDNDGWKDLMIANGYRKDVTNLDFIIYGKQTLFMGTAEANRKDRLDALQKFEGIHVNNYLFRNKTAQNGGQLAFENVSEDWGFTQPSYSNGSAYGDLDNDGDLDLVFNNLDELSSIYENQTNQIKPESAWLRIGFHGAKGNKDGLGTKVWLWQNGQMQYNYFSPYRGYLSTVEPYLHFGLQNKKIDSLKVMWADGKVQIIKNPKANQVLVLDNKNAQTPLKIKAKVVKSELFVDNLEETGLDFLHQEDGFIDFKVQALLPHLHSKNGPGLAVGDVNGDGLDDFFVGAGASYKGSIFIQQKNGKFMPKSISETNVADDMGALFFDADQDGDQDLFIASGGSNTAKNGDAMYQSRLFMNDGKGNFTKNINALPKLNTSASSVIASDYDHDGDLDLFIAGRVSPGEYPVIPKSFLLENNKGIFIDKTPPELKNIGMVTSALFTDYDNDGWQDLMLAGEFMPITFFKNEKGKTFKHSSINSFNHCSGWWNSLVSGDFDKDGDIDYVAGNLGLNTRYKVNSKEPVSVYAKDYDKNGLLDPIMTHYVNGKEQISHARDDLSKQITAMRARFTDYTTYAETPFKDSFTNAELADALVLKSELFESSYIENLGNGKFAIRALPFEAQFSPIFGMMADDFDNDGNLDVLAVGNSFATEVQTGRYDAQGGLFLKGNGNGGFTSNRAAFNIKGDNKSLVSLQNAKNETMVLVGTNSGKLQNFIAKNISQKTISLQGNDAYAVFQEKNGKKYRQEFYYGHSYLSMKSRKITIPIVVQSVAIFDFKGNKRSVQL